MLQEVTHIGVLQDQLALWIEKVGSDEALKLAEMERRNAARWEDLEQRMTERGKETKECLKRMKDLLKSVLSRRHGWQDTGPKCRT